MAVTVVPVEMKAGDISNRAQRRLKELPVSPFPAPSGPFYDVDVHPDGTINLSTAENTLLTKDVLKTFHETQPRSQHTKYRSTLTRSSIIQLEDLIPRYINMNKPIRPVTRQNSVVGPGVGALLAQLIWTICDEGDGVLLSTPFYHDYARDLAHPGKAKLVLAHVPGEIEPLSPAVIPILRQRIRSSEEEGTKIRCFVLCNPHNPIPRCYPIETIEGYIDLAKEFGLHLIVDEIFANSTYSTLDNPKPTPFTSILSLPAWAVNSPILDRIHVLGGPSKDLGCSGFKAAILVTENQQVRKSICTALQATPVSGATDALLSEVLRDETRLRSLLKKNQDLLGSSMDFCAAWARFHGLPYVGATAGVYFILDLSPVAKNLGLEGKEATIAMMRRMIDHKVHINPMDLDAYPKKHCFRFIFAHPIPLLAKALSRIERALDLPSWPEMSKSLPQANGH